MAWAYLSSVGLHIDYFKYRQLPKSRREKLKEIAQVVEKTKIELMAAMSFGSSVKDLMS